jgi:polysaccharide export outer membrane protein
MKTAITTVLCFAMLYGSAAAQHQPPQADQRPAPPKVEGAIGTTGTTPRPDPANAGAAVVPGDYHLAIGDKLRVEVYKDDQLSQSVQIRPDGKITLPLLGDIVAAGQTPTGLRDSLATALREYITNPVVTVIVVEATPATVFVMGEVTLPGPKPMHGQMSVLEALSMAGGFKDFAKTGDIKVLRKSSAGTTDTIRFNYKKAVKGEEQPVMLRPGDIVVVP